MSPIPLVRGKERSRTKNGRWRKKRFDIGKCRVSYMKSLNETLKQNKPKKKVTTIIYCKGMSRSYLEGCKHSIEGRCQLKQVHLTISYGRSTDYVDEFMCEECEK